MMNYNPGLHIISELRTSSARISDMEGARVLFDQLIGSLGLEKLGEVYHAFPGGGFTAVVCLTESHLSVHTWPEYGIITFDVFLSNYQKDNDQKTRAIHEATLKFFETESHTVHEIKR